MGHEYEKSEGFTWVMNRNIGERKEQRSGTRKHFRNNNAGERQEHRSGTNKMIRSNLVGK